MSTRVYGRAYVRRFTSVNVCAQEIAEEGKVYLDQYSRVHAHTHTRMRARARAPTHPHTHTATCLAFTSSLLASVRDVTKEGKQYQLNYCAPFTHVTLHEVHPDPLEGRDCGT